MINFYKKNDSIIISGHANSLIFDVKKNDLVCSAFSSIIFGFIAYLKINKFSNSVTIKKNDITIKNFSKINKTMPIAIDLLVTQLRNLEHFYPKNIKINYNKENETK